MKEVKQKLTLYRPATYQIKVQGRLDKSWNEWDEKMTVTIESEDNHPPVTILSGTVDQAALVGLLRRLYAMGLPLISVNCVDADPADIPDANK
jgi:hypothetical protein